MIYHGYTWSKKEATAKFNVRRWFNENNVPEHVQKEILEANGYDYEDAWDYAQTLCCHCHNETVNQKGRRMCLECFSMDV